MMLKYSLSLFIIVITITANAQLYNCQLEINAEDYSIKGDELFVEIIANHCGNCPEEAILWCLDDTLFVNPYVATISDGRAELIIPTEFIGISTLRVRSKCSPSYQVEHNFTVLYEKGKKSDLKLIDEFSYSKPLRIVAYAFNYGDITVSCSGCSSFHKEKENYVIEIDQGQASLQLSGYDENGKKIIIKSLLVGED